MLAREEGGKAEMIAGYVKTLRFDVLQDERKYPSHVLGKVCTPSVPTGNKKRLKTNLLTQAELLCELGEIVNSAR
jgi:hypothetical protein